MAGWPERRACLSAGWAQRRAYRRTYKRTQVARAVGGPVAYERRARCAPPGESGQPSAYDLRKFGPVEHHAYHSMILVACAIVTNRVPVPAGPSQAEFEGSYQSDSSIGFINRLPSAAECSDAHLAPPLAGRGTSTRCRQRLCSTRTWSGAKGEHAVLAHEPRGGPLNIAA
jgi:hypothetical protein